MIKTITVSELKQKIDNKEQFILLDARTQKEYDEGHIKNSVLIPFNELEERYSELNAEKDSEIIVYCRTQNRSQIAAKILLSLGYTNISFVLGGFMEWHKNGYPVSK